MKTKTIKGDMVLKNDTSIDCHLRVEGDIVCEGKLFSLTITGDISAGNITAWNISAGNILAEDITAGNIIARDIIAGNITAEDISAGNITARYLSARDIIAGDISTWDISARDISYRAFCISYTNIRCSTIKGRRVNSFHKALDGKVAIAGEQGGKGQPLSDKEKAG